MYSVPAHRSLRCALPFSLPPGVLAVAMSLLLLIVASAAASAEMAVEVTQIGWNGIAVPGAWNPVRVRATGDGANANVRIEVVSIARQQNGPQGATVVEYATGAYGQEVALPAGVTKEVTLWIPVAAGGAPVGSAGLVRVTAGDRLLAEQRVEFRSTKTPFWPLIGILAESPAPAKAISQVELPYQGLPIPLTVATLLPSDLPASGERLGAISALVVQGSVAATLTSDQRQAVQDWVTAGGHLVLSGGPQAARVASILPQNALPVTFAATDAAIDLEPLAKWAGVQENFPATGPATSFHAAIGSTLAGSTAQPLAWRMGMGQGTVTLLAVDPGLEPLAAWSGTPSILRKALDPALPKPDENEKMRIIRAQEAEVPNRLQNVVDALPPGVFPSWQNVALILGGFAILAGPLLHLLLWRADRRGWLWLSVPPAALLVAAGLYYFGIGRYGKDIITNTVAHVQMDPEGSQSKEWLLAGFYAPTHPRLTIDVPTDAPVRVL
ncbi:MAG TPA: hypothetical protein VHS06_08625, partial [Chloroflexota bacterium]|nr:hypothetical protein [Chloroflexota bacterium]